MFAVLSTGSEDMASDCKVTPTKFDQIVQMLAQDQAPAFDLVALDANGPEEGISGARLDFFDFLVLNYSGVAQSGTCNFSIYLSTDDIVTPRTCSLAAAPSATAWPPTGGCRCFAIRLLFCPRTPPRARTSWAFTSRSRTTTSTTT